MARDQDTKKQEERIIPDISDKLKGVPSIKEREERDEALITAEANARNACGDTCLASLHDNYPQAGLDYEERSLKVAREGMEKLQR